MKTTSKTTPKKTKTPRTKTLQPQTFRIKPLQDRIIIKEETETAEKKTSSGIIIPITVTANEDKGSKRGIVVAVGSGRLEDGKLIKPSLAVGDKVLFQWGDKIQVDGHDGHGTQEYYIVRESEILAVIK